MMISAGTPYFASTLASASRCCGEEGPAAVDARLGDEDRPVVAPRLGFGRTRHRGDDAVADLALARAVRSCPDAVLQRGVAHELRRCATRQVGAGAAVGQRRRAGDRAAWAASIVGGSRRWRLAARARRAAARGEHGMRAFAGRGDARRIIGARVARDAGGKPRVQDRRREESGSGAERSDCRNLARAMAPARRHCPCVGRCARTAITMPKPASSDTAEVPP